MKVRTRKSRSPRSILAPRGPKFEVINGVVVTDDAAILVADIGFWN